MMTNFRSFHYAAALALLAFPAGCIENPNSVGTETNATGGTTQPSNTGATGGSSTPATGLNSANNQPSGGTAATVNGSGATGATPASAAGGSAATNGATLTGAGGVTALTTGGHGGSSGAVSTTPTQQVVRSDLPQDSNPAIDAADYQAFISGTNELGLELFRRKAVSEENLVFSPVSLQVALSMAYAGARNATSAQMEQVLGDPFGDETYHQAVNKLIVDLRSRNLTATSSERPQSVELALVDTWFLQQRYPIEQSYLDLLATRYDAGVRLTDFEQDLEAARASINQFASDSTHGKITNLIRPGDIVPLTRAVLLNALYLNATWKDPFAVADTSNANFTTAAGETVSVPSMRSTRGVAYQAGSNYQALQLPYIGEALNLMLVLPAPGEFASVRAAFDSSWIASVSSTLARQAVALSLPKFRISWGTEAFNDDLQALGMVDAFQAGVADFTGISDAAKLRGLHVTNVLQKAFVGVDEAGTEAAAVSAVVLGEKSGAALSIAFNRPFLFAILDRSGALLFVGQVMDPR